MQNPPSSLADCGNFAWNIVAAPERADKTATVYVPSEGPPRRLSFGALDDASGRGARVLHDLGLEKGDRVLVVVPRVPAFYEVMVACMKGGFVSMPGTNLLTASDLAYRIRRSGAKAVFVHESHAAKIDEIAAECPTLKHKLLFGTERPGWLDWRQALQAAAPLTCDEAPTVAATDPMIVYFTSGTTAHPKMVARDYTYAYAHRKTAEHWMGLRDGDLHWTVTDTGWAKAAWGLLFPQWLLGATTVLYEGQAAFDAKAHLETIASLRVTTFCAPPTVYRLFAQLDLSAYDLSSLRRSLSAGEPLNPEVIRTWQAATGHAPADGYGQTETVCLVANQPGMALRRGSMGRPVPGLDVRVVDEYGIDCPTDEVGHIAVRLPKGCTPDSASVDEWPVGLFRGYEDDADGQRAFHDGHYFTGDTARRDEDGYIWFIGRSDDLISSAGYRISPFEVESALQEHEAIVESAVVAKPDAIRGHVVVAFVVLAEGFEASEALAERIQRHVRTATAPYKYPREIYFRQTLPKTVSGKLRRVELRASLAKPNASEQGA